MHVRSMHVHACRDLTFLCRQQQQQQISDGSEHPQLHRRGGSREEHQETLQDSSCHHDGGQRREVVPHVYQRVRARGGRKTLEGGLHLRVEGETVVKWAELWNYVRMYSIEAYLSHEYYLKIWHN